MQQTVRQAGGIRLSDILPNCRFSDAGDLPVHSCCADSRRCEPGDLFVALSGSRHDGHDFADHAAASGASAVLAERPLPIDLPVFVVPDTHRAFGQICQALAGHPSRHLTTVGVTGTAGKTVTAILIAGVLKAARHRVGVTGSLGHCDTIESVDAARTTPKPPELARWMARMSTAGCTHGIIETSSESLARRGLAGVALDTAVLTNVRRAHLDLHGSMLNYRKVKGAIFDHLKPNGVAVVNADDPGSKFLLDRVERPLLTVAMHAPAELNATVVERHKSEQTFLLSAGNETVPVRSHMIGDHHVYNCLAAAAVGLVEGIDLPTIVRGLEAVDMVPGRLERLEHGQPFGVFVDAARTPEALATVLKTLRRVTGGRLICVFGAQGERDEETRPILGRTVERLADLGVVTSDNPRGEKPLRVIHDVLDGYDRPARAHVMPDRARAICWALADARSDDTVVVAGKGCEDYQVVGPSRFAFDDRQVASHWLREVGIKDTDQWLMSQ